METNADNNKTTEPDVKPTSSISTTMKRLSTSAVEDMDLLEEMDEIQSTDRPESSQSSDSSVAVNCPAFPTEVVVHGRKVQKVRVLFTPHPPRLSATACRESFDIQPSRRRGNAAQAAGVKVSASCESVQLGLRRRHRDSGTAMQVTDDSRTPVPFSQEESTSVFDFSSSSHHTTSSMDNQTLVSRGTPEMEHYHLQGIDRKIRQDILNGLNYLEKRKEELMDSNKRLRLDMDNLNRSNEHLRELVTENETRYRRLEIENDELKSKLDSNEKEIARLGDQALTEWNSRVKLEESFVELKRDKGEEIRTLGEELRVKDSEIRDLQTAIIDNNNKPKEAEKNFDRFELLHKVASLEDTIRRLQLEKERVNEMTTKLEQEVADWKGRFETKSQELEVQVGRFLALKRSFNELSTENEKLAKNQIRGLQSHHVINQIANSTWPSAGGNGHTESIRIIDLPESSSKSSAGSFQSGGSAGRAAVAGTRESQRIGAHQCRKKSHDSSCSDPIVLLPPVSRPINR